MGSRGCGGPLNVHRRFARFENDCVTSRRRCCPSGRRSGATQAPPTRRSTRLVSDLTLGLLNVHRFARFENDCVTSRRRCLSPPAWPFHRHGGAASGQSNNCVNTFTYNCTASFIPPGATGKAMPCEQSGCQLLAQLLERREGPPPWRQNGRRRRQFSPRGFAQSSSRNHGRAITVAQSSSRNHLRAITVAKRWP